MRLESQPRRADRILTHRGQQELVLLDPESGMYFTLDEVGARVWELADGRATVAVIADALAAEFDAPLETIIADLLELLGELEESGLVIDAEPAQGA